jgi:uncharacterized damage-inducible protein DinB
MQSHDIALLFDHLYWVRDKILAAADDPGMDWPGEAPTGLRGLRATLVHELDVEWSWRRRLQAEDRTDFAGDDVELMPDEFDDVAAVRARWLEDEAEMRAWLEGISDADLAGPCGVERRGPGHPLWFHLLHVYSHGMQQLSDAAWMLSSQDGGSPGEIDFLEFVEAREAR